MIADLSHGIFLLTQNASEDVNPEPVQIFFTSGTTGDPKMVVHDSTYPFALGITGNHISPQFCTSCFYIHEIFTFETSKYIN